MVRDIDKREEEKENFFKAEKQRSITVYTCVSCLEDEQIYCF